MPSSIAIVVGMNDRAATFLLGGDLEEECVCVLQKAWQTFTRRMSHRGTRGGNILLEFCEMLEIWELPSIIGDREQERTVCQACGKETRGEETVGTNLSKVIADEWWQEHPSWEES